METPAQQIHSHRVKRRHVRRRRNKAEDLFKFAIGAVVTSKALQQL
jgi:hypothetical protein